MSYLSHEATHSSQDSQLGNTADSFSPVVALNGKMPKMYFTIKFKDYINREIKIAEHKEQVSLCLLS